MNRFLDWIARTIGGIDGVAPISVDQGADGVHISIDLSGGIQATPIVQASLNTTQPTPETGILAGLQFLNPTTATANTQVQDSPAVLLTSSGWNSGTNTSWTTEFAAKLRPVVVNGGAPTPSVILINRANNGPEGGAWPDDPDFEFFGGDNPYFRVTSKNLTNTTTTPGVTLRNPTNTTNTNTSQNSPTGYYVGNVHNTASNTSTPLEITAGARAVPGNPPTADYGIAARVGGAGNYSDVLRVNSGGDATLPVGGGGLVLTGGTSGSAKVVAPATGGGTLTLPPGTGTLALSSGSGLNQLTGDVTAGPGSGSQAATVAQIQGTAVNGTTGNANTAVVLAAQPTIALTDGGTTTTPVLATFDHESSGTPAASFGGVLRMAGASSNTAKQAQADITSQWSNAAHASREASWGVGVYDVGNLRPGLAIDATSGGANAGFFSSPNTAAYGGGVGVVAIPKATTNPTSNTANTVLLYVDSSSGALSTRDSSGNVANLSAAASSNKASGSGTTVTTPSTTTLVNLSKTNGIHGSMTVKNTGANPMSVKATVTSIFTGGSTNQTQSLGAGSTMSFLFDQLASTFPSLDPAPYSAVKVEVFDPSAHTTYSWAESDAD